VTLCRKPDKFDSSGLAVTAGLMDARLGVPPRASYLCGTCGGDDQTCPGHFGSIQLEKPVFHCGMLTILQKILSCCCHGCGKIMADDNDPKFRDAKRIKHPQARLAAMANICKGKKICQHKAKNTSESSPDSGCGTIHPSVLRQGLNFKLKFPVANSNGDVPEEMTGERTLYADGVNGALEILKKCVPPPLPETRLLLVILVPGINAARPPAQDLGRGHHYAWARPALLPPRLDGGDSGCGVPAACTSGDHD
jgi:DNA-directed RNA polymerase beta' subunit